MLTFRELAWAAYVYAIATKGDRAYWEVEKSRKLLDDFVRAPRVCDLKRIEEVVVGQFLNRWGLCMIPGKKGQGIAGGIERELERLDTAERDSLCGLSIADVGDGGLSNSCAGRIVELYDTLCSIDGCGPTVVSKILFLLFPKLFVMWDGAIRHHWKNREPPIRTEDGKGYVTFLDRMGEMAKRVCDDYTETLGRRDRPEDYLSRGLYAEPKTKTLAKYLDEYGWMRITIIGAIQPQDMLSEVFPPRKWLTTLAHS